MIYTREQLKALVEMSDADGVWALLKDQGLYEEANWVEMNYFEL